MGILELILLSVGLAMDAFSVSVCKGLNMKKLSLKNGAVIALFFGVFRQECLLSDTSLEADLQILSLHSAIG